MPVKFFRGEDIKWVKVAIDDILIAAENEHDKSVRLVLQRLKDLGLTANAAKSEFKVKEINFFGMKISKDGFKPNEHKMQDFIDAPSPKSASEARAFVGLANYLGSHISCLSDVTSPIRELYSGTKKQFVWSTQCQTAFEATKENLIQKCLVHYNIDDDSELVVDASPVGASAWLLQHRKYGSIEVIACASRSFSDTEKRYSQVEREGLAAVWACERFYLELICQKRFTLTTDNKTIEYIYNAVTDRKRTNTRLATWRDDLQPFKFKVKHIEGSKNIADYMSRCMKHKPYKRFEEIQERTFRLNDFNESETTVKMQSSLFPITIEEVATATKEDATLNRLKSALLNNDQRSAPAEFNKLFKEISIHQSGVMVRIDQIIIPDSLVSKVLKLAHEAHFGCTLTKRFLRNRIYFKNLDKLVEKEVLNCPACEANTDTSRMDPLLPSSLPNGPMEEISVDYSSRTPTNEYVLAAVCGYSRYPFMNLARELW